MDETKGWKSTAVLDEKEDTLSKSKKKDKKKKKKKKKKKHKHKLGAESSARKSSKVSPKRARISSPTRTPKSGNDETLNISSPPLKQAKLSEKTAEQLAAQTPKPRGVGRPKHKAWQHFEELRKSPKSTTVTCRYCDFFARNPAVKDLKSHLAVCEKAIELGVDYKANGTSDDPTLSALSITKLIFECENGCGFEDPSCPVVEKHEATCTFVKPEVKSGPGRPWKVPLDESNKPLNRPKTLKTKRGPGRSKKRKVETKSKRGPGRPRKDPRQTQPNGSEGPQKRKLAPGRPRKRPRETLEENPQQDGNEEISPFKTITLFCKTDLFRALRETKEKDLAKEQQKEVLSRRSLNSMSEAEQLKLALEFSLRT